MVKLICPHCMKSVPVPDDFSGREVTCPSCMKTFDAPARYDPAVIGDTPPAPTPRPPAPPPVPAAVPEPSAVVPPPVVVPPAAPSAAVPTPTAEGYTRSCGITISPRVVAWLPAVFLTVTFLFTFLHWIGAYFGGSPAYWQSPWRAMFKSVGQNAIYTQYMPGDGSWVKQVSSDFLLMFPFLVLLIVAMAFAWFDRALDVSHPFVAKRLGKVWPWRKTVVAGAAALALIFVLLQLANGFGMENAIRRSVRDHPDIVKARQEAEGAPSKEAVVDNRVAAEIAKFNIERKWWQDIAIYSLIAAVLAVVLSIALDGRGDKPPPRLVLHY